MKCVAWKGRMELILSEYLISIRVVDYCSLGLLSKNKIRERVLIGKYILISVRECKKSQLTNAEQWQELEQMLTIARGWNWMPLINISSTASQQKKTISPNAAACKDLIHDQCTQGFEAPETCRGSLFHKVTLKALLLLLSEPGQTRRPGMTSFL